jgi:TrpR-related protein YerC/YecD
MPINWRTKRIEHFVSALTNVTDPKDMRKLLRDLLTVEEIETISKRLYVAKLLEEGMTYRAIAQKTSMSTATVTRIAHWLKHGTGGFKVGLNKET